ncbi:Guanine nucleotide-releasing factor 2 [Clonorchis sinensis]|uniref:Guanine nucleotide-releasing factor 2 n=1 Tax=Clonorchis sinensis TaxID=79923 RepID=A0A8T1MJP4_CLOSI|nr:Guanine nucleotide-releasing factor 2 [Clonorchis sinensis]
MPKKDQDVTKGSLPPADVTLKEIVTDPHKQMIHGKDKKSFWPRQIFRRKKNAPLPAIDIPKVQANLITDMSALASQLVVTVTLSNHTKWVNQVTESLSLVRRHVATGAACIQPFLLTAGGTSVSVNYRPAIEKLSDFHDAYVGFLDWIQSVSSLDNLAQVPPGSNLINGSTRCRGQALFNALQFSALAVFDLLQVSGFTSAVDPTQWEALSHGHFPKEVDITQSTSTVPSVKIDEKVASCDMLTDSDRALLAKLWSQVDALSESDQSYAPPQKPPHPHDTQSEPTAARISSTRRRSHVINDPGLSAYLASLVSAILPPIQDSTSFSASPDDFVPESPLPPPPPPPKRSVSSRCDGVSDGTETPPHAADVADSLKIPVKKSQNPSRWSSALPDRPPDPRSDPRKNRSLVVSHDMPAATDRPLPGTPVSPASSLSSLGTTPQVVVAPSLPDGTGPDLSRAVFASGVPNIEAQSNSPCSEPLSPTDETDSVVELSDTKSRKSLHGVKNETSFESSRETDDHLSEADEEPSPIKPPRPNIPSRSESLRPLTQYMFQFGLTEMDPESDRRLSVNLTNFFRSSWDVQESAEGPHQRLKKMSYVQTYAQPTPDGDVHHSTSVQHTCSVRLVGGLEALRDGASADVASESEDATKPLEPDDTGDSMEVARSEDIPETVQIPESLSSLQQPPKVVESTPTEFPICREILGLIKADEYLVWTDSESHKEVSVHAGSIDALIVYLTSFGSMSPSYYLFSEAFLFTYRAFMSPADLIKRLIIRYKLFRDDAAHTLVHRQAHAKVRSATGSTLVSVVSRLREDLTPELQSKLMKFKKSLISDKARSLAKYLDVNIQNQLAWQKRQQEEQAQALLEEQQRALHQKPEPDVSNGHPAPTESISAASDSEDAPTMAPPKPPERYGSAKPLPLEPTARASKLPSEDSPPEPNILSFSSQDIAEQMTLLEAQKYSRIQISELLNIRNLERGKAPSVSACALHFSSLSNWATHQILGAPASDRDKIANKLMDVMEHLHTLQNFSSYLSILCSFMLIPDNVFSKKTHARLSQVKPYMQPPHFSKYRRELEVATPPLIPYLGLMMQNLIVLAQGNPLFHSSPPPSLENIHKPAHGPIVNFWRCWKHFLIIHFIVKQENMDPEKAHYNITPKSQVLDFLNDFKDSPSEEDLRRLANKLRRGEI